ncbi:MAG: RNA polymerase sigma factor RpoD/SigA [Fibrobacteria bacterium]|nr:RNA polymerase sigma factor RpoD/SigA [Fibrobacteria bacterium]
MNNLNEQLYIRDLHRHPVLTPEEERDYIRRLKVNPEDKDAQDRLVTGNLRFVVSVARRYQNRGLSLLELVSEGNIGLFKAAQRFDETKEVKFISYAVWWIRQGIQKALFDQVGTVRIPPNKLSLANKFKRTLARNGGDYEKTIELPEFKNYADEIPELLEKMEEISLNSPIGGGEDGENTTTLLDLLGTDGEHELEREMAELKTSLEKVLRDLLTEREAKVLSMYYGINYSKEFTFDEIGRELKLTRERVRQIKNKSLNKLLKNKSAKDILEPFLDSRSPEA